MKLCPGRLVGVFKKHPPPFFVQLAGHVSRAAGRGRVRPAPTRGGQLGQLERQNRRAPLPCEPCSPTGRPARVISRSSVWGPKPVNRRRRCASRCSLRPAASAALTSGSLAASCHAGVAAVSDLGRQVGVQAHRTAHTPRRQGGDQGPPPHHQARPARLLCSSSMASRDGSAEERGARRCDCSTPLLDHHLAEEQPVGAVGRSVIETAAGGRGARGSSRSSGRNAADHARAARGPAACTTLPSTRTCLRSHDLEVDAPLEAAAAHLGRHPGRRLAPANDLGPGLGAERPQLGGVMDLSRLVLPCPFWPKNTVARGPGRTSPGRGCANPGRAGAQDQRRIGMITAR